MQEMKYQELENRAIRAEALYEIKSLQARARVHDVIAEMRAEGKALTLTE